MLLAEKSKRNECFFISESLALDWYIFVALTNKRLLLPLQCRLKQNFLFDLEKLIDYWGSAVNVVRSNPCVGPIRRIKVLFSYYQYAQRISYELKK